MCIVELVFGERFADTGKLLLQKFVFRKRFLGEVPAGATHVFQVGKRRVAKITVAD